MVKNRIHALLDRYHVPAPRNCCDRISHCLRSCPTRCAPPSSGCVKAYRESVCGDHRVELLRTVPGLGDLLATMVALEIDRIERFASEAKLAVARRSTAS